MMSDRLDRLVRQTVHDLAGEADVISDRDRRRLALHATDRAWRLRRQRYGVVAGTVALVVALAVGLPYGLRYLSTMGTVPLPTGVADIPGVPTHVIEDYSEPIELVDGWYVVGNRMVLNRGADRYTPFNAETVIPSPNGRWVATQGRTEDFRVYDLQNGTNRRYAYQSLLPWSQGHHARMTAWSPDGDTLLVAEWASEVGDSFLLDGVPYQGPIILALALDLTESSPKFTQLWTVPADGLPCEPCNPFWLPSGDAIGVLLPEGIQSLALDSGARGPVVPIRGYPVGDAASWSPDGRQALVHGPDPGDGAEWTPSMQLVDAQTGEVLRQWDGMTVHQVQWVDDERFLAWEWVAMPETARPGGTTKHRAMASLWGTDGTLHERWLPPTDVVGLPPYTTSPLAVHLG